MAKLYTQKADIKKTNVKKGMKRFLSVILFTLLAILISSCATSKTKNSIDSNKTNTIYYIQIDENDKLGEGKHYSSDTNQWNVTTTVIKKQDKPKTFFYNFKITSSNEFTVSDINYKYGTYGKWRIIKKLQYLDNDSSIKKNQKTITIQEFPITIKKSGSPHNQLIQLTLMDKNSKKHYVNLIFGVQKCLSKSEKEFVCF